MDKIKENHLLQKLLRRTMSVNEKMNRMKDSKERVVETERDVWEELNAKSRCGLPLTLPT